MKSGDNELKDFQKGASQCGKFKEVKLKLLIYLKKKKNHEFVKLSHN